MFGSDELKYGDLLSAATLFFNQDVRLSSTAGLLRNYFMLLSKLV